MGWQLRDELRRRAAEDAERVERRAARIAGALLLMLAVYVVIDASGRLIGVGEQASESRLGIAIEALSLVVMGTLAYAKLKMARALHSRALPARRRAGAVRRRRART